MTLFRQIAILLSIFLIILLATVLLLNFQSANQSAKERLYEDAKNTSSSLALSLGSANGDLSMMATMINANFDSGNYNRIVLFNVDGEIIHEKKNELRAMDAPQWFIDTIHIEAPIAISNVSAGWSQVGLLEVQSDVGYAYVYLYTIFKNLLLSFATLSFIGLLVLNLILALILRPLKRIEHQAAAVLRNEFIIQENIPYTKEFRDVILGMNAMITKLKSMFDKASDELKKYKEQEYVDGVTKLRNRKYLIDKLPEFLKIDASSRGGMSMMVALVGAKEANEQIGHRDVDNLYVDIAHIFQSQARIFTNAIVSRINGTEFSLFLPNCTADEGLAFAQEIHKSVQESILSRNLDDTKTYIAIGLYEYNHKQTIAELLSYSDNALSKAKFTNTLIHLDTAEESVEVMGKDAWRNIMSDAIDYARFSFVSWHVYNAKLSKVDHNVLSISMQDEKGNTYSYGQYMASAIELGLSSKVYQAAIELLFRVPETKLKNTTCSLRLSYEYLAWGGTYGQLTTLFEEFANDLPFKLIVEVPDKLVREKKELMQKYKTLFETYNIEIGLFEFIGEGEDYNYLQDLRPIYIKAESSYFVSQSDASLSTLRLITDTIGTSLIATSVMDKTTYLELEKKGIFIVQGKITEVLKLM
ncbi:MAG: LapD/MoxY N-terminal periplasmic domain-containing protein [Sulfurimonadaceae bacterium]|jgi:diguanylate cyclase (GGDEF)-like protein|nr:LapD/MoxY N-terminal periplasmic domain-containing protein [Sulfurimonadaceae bacterium]